jgi:ubiquinone/menaquinone biosynthesis C-methylase UbiE
MNKATLDEVRNFWNSRPCNIRHGLAPLGTREYFDQVETRKYMVEPHIPGFSEFERWKGKKVLEIGCGIGTAASSFAKAGASYTGIELSEKSLEITKQRFEVLGLKGEFYLGNAEELSQFLPSDKYDLIYSFGVIHHAPNPDKIIEQIRAYMLKESELRIMLYAKKSWKNIMIEGGLDQPEAQSGCPIAFTYTEEEVRELLKGFQVSEIKQDHIFPYIVEKYVNYEYELQPWFQSMPKEMFRALEKKLGWHLLIKARLA